MSISIQIESPQAPDVRALIEALDSYQAPLYPPESNHLLEALGLYRAAGFQECAAFGEYQPDPLSIFMELQLSR